MVTLSPAETALLARLNAQDTELRQKCQEVSLKLAAAQDVLSSSEKELEVLKTQQEDVEKELKSAEVTERVELQQKESLLKSLEKKESDARKAFDGGLYFWAKSFSLFFVFFQSWRKGIAKSRLERRSRRKSLRRARSVSMLPMLRLRTPEQPATDYTTSCHRSVPSNKTSEKS